MMGVMNTMKSLTDKYPGGYEEWEREFQLSQGRSIKSGSVVDAETVERAELLSMNVPA